MEFVYKLFKYRYERTVQGTVDFGEEYALLYVPKDASFNNNRSTLVNKKSQLYYHEIDIESIQDLTVQF